MTSSRKHRRQRRSTFDRGMIRRLLVFGGGLAAFGVALYAFFFLFAVSGVLLRSGVLRAPYGEAPLYLKLAPLLLHNRAGQGNHWIGLTLQGTTCNRDAIGARISWSVNGTVTRRFRTGAGSYLSAHDPREILGLGTATSVDWVEIAWPAPSKQVDRFTNLKVDAYQRIVEGKGGG